MGKFNVGDKVYHIRSGMGKIIEVGINGTYPVIVDVDATCMSFTVDGKYHNGDLNPTLLTLDEARAKGYDVPEEPKPKVKMYLYAFKKSVGSSWYVSSNLYKDDAEFKGTTGYKTFQRLNNTMIEVDDV